MFNRLLAGARGIVQLRKTPDLGDLLSRGVLAHEVDPVVAGRDNREKVPGQAFFCFRRRRGPVPLGREDCDRRNIARHEAIDHSLCGAVERIGDDEAEGVARRGLVPAAVGRRAPGC